MPTRKGGGHNLLKSEPGHNWQNASEAALWENKLSKVAAVVIVTNMNAAAWHGSSTSNDVPGQLTW
jgi:hypothetical protein